MTKEKEQQIALAEAQLLGFNHGKKGFNALSLVQDMGLKPWEWHNIKKDYPSTVEDLSEADREEIEEWLLGKEGGKNV